MTPQPQPPTTNPNTAAKKTKTFPPASITLASIAVLASLSSCSTTTTQVLLPSAATATPIAFAEPKPPSRYAAIENEPFNIPPVDTNKIDPQYLKQQVDYQTEYRPGTIVVDPKNRFLYLIQDGGKALRYGVGVGKAGLEFTGTAHIGFKREWPRWTPTPEMLKRDPSRYAAWANGMEAGETNPLGPRALYLVKDGKDTLYRIHGTTEPWSIGKAASSGCIRMLNQDVIDLYSKVPTGSDIVVL